MAPRAAPPRHAPFCMAEFAAYRQNRQTWPPRGPGERAESREKAPTERKPWATSAQAKSESKSESGENPERERASIQRAFPDDRPGSMGQSRKAPAPTETSE